MVNGEREWTPASRLGPESWTGVENAGRFISTVPGHSKAVWYLAFSPDGQRLVTADDAGVFKIWDAETSQGTLSLQAHSRLYRTDRFAVAPILSVVFSPDGSRLALLSGTGQAEMWPWMPPPSP